MKFVNFSVSFSFLLLYIYIFFFDAFILEFLQEFVEFNFVQLSSIIRVRVMHQIEGNVNIIRIGIRMCLKVSFPNVR